MNDLDYTGIGFSEERVVVRNEAYLHYPDERRQAAKGHVIKVAARYAAEVADIPVHADDCAYSFSTELRAAVAVCSEQRMRELVRREARMFRMCDRETSLTDEKEALIRKLNEANRRLDALDYAINGR